MGVSMLGETFCINYTIFSDFENVDILIILGMPHYINILLFIRRKQ